MAIIETGSAAVGTANVDTDNNLQVVAPGFTADGTERGGGNVNSNAMFSEVDDGTLTGVREMLSPEVDKYGQAYLYLYYTSSDHRSKWNHYQFIKCNYYNYWVNLWNIRHVSCWWYAEHCL